MKFCFVIISVAVLSSTSFSRPTEVETDEEAPPNPRPSPRLDFYAQITKNVADKIAVPFYKFIGVRSQVVKGRPSNTSLGQVELVDDEITKEEERIGIPGIKEHGLQKTREREDLSEETIRRHNTETKKKPIKIIQYMIKDSAQSNITDQINELDFTDIDFDKKSLFDTDYVSDPHQKATVGGTMISYAEIFMGLVDLLWGGFKAWWTTRFRKVPQSQQ